MRKSARQFLASDTEPIIDHDGDHIAIGLRGGQIVAAMRGRPLAGRIAAIWPARFHPSITSEMLHRLFEAVASSMSVDELALVQAVVDSQQGDAADHFRSLGFSVVAELLFLLMPTNVEHKTHPTLEFHPYRRNDRQRLVEAIDATLEETSDCKRLNGVRTSAEIVDGYVEDAKGDFSGWFLVRRHNQDVGCLLLADRKADELVDISYMGLATSARGNGLGGWLVRYALEVSASWGRRHVLAVVDEENWPARKCYELCGGFQWDRRVLMAKTNASFRNNT